MTFDWIYYIVYDTRIILNINVIKEEVIAMIKNKTVTTLSQNLKKIRLVHHLTQHDFASIIHKHRVYICELEGASRNPSFDTLYQISHYLQIPLTTLLAPCTCRMLEQYPPLDSITSNGEMGSLSDVNMNLFVGKSIKAKRKRKNFSQNKLAELTHVHRVHLSNIECGKTSPTLKLLDAIADSLGCETWELMEDTQENITL